MQHAVAGDAGIVDKDVDGAEVFRHLRQTGRAGLEIRHVPFVDRDAGVGLELRRGFIVAGVVGCDAIAGSLQRLADGRANSA